ncbi:AAA family ATPase [Pseudoduganella plicata]|uniref:Endonuclease GajA/Old nuclease/RecF-like AAA domain-containing protein n=1 Tax=Pseudoduganella plicata TaxID=321984 RepID=A0A4P7BC86_9BURK|nr:ATP-binding protein [Pseudoduganella plicata]QBQ36124.1 hypothetical protein E1742_08130 [Pseudoduganella plicata]GGY77903.1 hypothetical protein GCM10007388_08410 [Pseudoduganella plicata]
MQLTKLILEDFKKVKKVQIDLAEINVLVGGNNAGKSSVLQGIHFSVAAAIASRIAGKDTYPQDSLLYCPSRNFEDLRHGAAYTNQTNFSFFRVYAKFADEEDDAIHVVRVYRGRNEGNVGCVRTNPRGAQYGLGLSISNSDEIFSIYVPGLAGIPQSEQYRSESVIRRGVASGDANLYLRNVLLQIQTSGKLPVLTTRMREIFPKFWIEVSFDPKRDIYIDVQISTTTGAGRKCPLELVGTGVLQTLQIFSYVTLFAPKLLLLDEPDSHLHPDNQSALAKALQYISEDTSTKIIVSTHSRHLVESLYESSNFIWLKDGKVFKQGVDIDVLPMLLDIGALDSYDKLKAGKINQVFLTEDSKMEFVMALASASGFDLDKTLFFSYKTSTNLEAAIILAEFLQDIAPNTMVIVHRDRDFMTDVEVELVEQRITKIGAHSFITEGSDIEDYFVIAEHVASLLQVDTDEVRIWLDELATDSHNDLSITYSRKRDAIKTLLYKKNSAEFPDTIKLLGKAIPLPVEKRKGKDMMKLVRADMHRRFGKTVDLKTPSDYLYSYFLYELSPL